jgi:hypothetical protein
MFPEWFGTTVASTARCDTCAQSAAFCTWKETRRVNDEATFRAATLWESVHLWRGHRPYDLSKRAISRTPISGFHSSHICYGLPVCSPPCTDPTSFLAVGDFYIQASGVSVTLPAAGYDYSSVWTPLLAGLSPAGMTASLAAQSHQVSWVDRRAALISSATRLGTQRDAI